MKRFKIRIPNLTLRVAHGLEQGRAKGLCPKNIASLCGNLLGMYSRHNYLDIHIWNRDESGAKAERNREAAFSIPKFYVSKGRSFRQIFIIRCEERACMGHATERLG